jgi:hypothetical protein
MNSANIWPNDMTSIEDTTGLSQVYDIHERTYTEASRKLSARIQERCEDFLRVKWLDGGRRSCEMTVCINGSDVGLMAFSEVDGLTVLNLFILEQAVRGFGIGTWILKKMTERRIFFCLRPTPFEIYNSNTWRGKSIPCPNVSQLFDEKMQFNEVKDAAKKQKLVRFYEKAGFKKCVIQGSKKEFMCNFQSQVPGLLHFYDLKHES